MCLVWRFFYVRFCNSLFFFFFILFFAIPEETIYYVLTLEYYIMCNFICHDK